MRMMIGLSVVAVLLSTVSSSAQESPGLEETAIFLISGKRANTLERHNDGGYIENTKKFSIEKDNFHNVGIVYKVLGDPKKCGVAVTEFDGHVKPSENLDNISFSIIVSTVYLFNNLNRQYTLQPTRSVDGSITFQEKLSGEQSICRFKFSGNDIKEKKCTNDMTFVNRDQYLMASREKAWTYLFNNFCSGNNQPF